MTATQNSTKDVINIYTRKEAIEDGVLLDVTAQAKPLRYKFPVALSEGVVNTLIKGRPGTREENITQFLKEALDTIRVAVAVKKRSGPTDKVCIEIRDHIVWYVCGPDDLGNPVLTFCFIEEL